MKNIVIGIDAANLRRGGGVTHLVELLLVSNPSAHGIDRVVIWGGKKTLDALSDRPWLEKRTSCNLNGGLFRRSLWQRFHLSKAVRDSACDVLFVPGGNYTGDFHPTVTMSRNMLPFEWGELKRYGFSLFSIKLLILRLVQSHSYKNVDGLIFLTEYAKKTILSGLGSRLVNSTIIPHGLNPRFSHAVKKQRAINEFNDLNPYRILYVSIIDQYKHQWNVVEAVASLRSEGFPVVLDLVGPAYPPALKRLNDAIARQKDGQSWVHYYGEIPFKDLHIRYAEADLGLFASSCENMPNILLEKMASGLPIACSNRGPMPEVLGSGGIYFDPENPSEIASRLRDLITSPKLRTQKAELSYQRARQYSWERCAFETLNFLVKIAEGKVSNA